MAYIFNLDHIDKSQSSLVGEKAATLGELIKAGFPVPPGFVITTATFEKFLALNKIDERIKSALENIDVENTQLLKEKHKEIENMILNYELHDEIKRAIKEAYDNLCVGREARDIGGAALDIIRAGRERVYVSVRSSVTNDDPKKLSFAGHAATFTNLSGSDKIVEAVRRVWASIYSPRSIYYRKKLGVLSQSTAVIVQKMVDADKSGSIFTSHPVSAEDEVVIEAIWGLGPALETPDEYVMKKSGGPLDKKIRRKESFLKRDGSGRTIRERVPKDRIEIPTLNDFEINKLNDIAKRIEGKFGGQPQDIEWCQERGRVFILQSRPITALEKKQDNQPAFGKTILSGSTASQGSASRKVKIVRNADDIAKIQDNEIAAAKFASLDFLPFFHKISGLVTDEGGILSNAAIIHREFGKPYLTATASATHVLKDDQEIILDSVNGRLLAPITGQQTDQLVPAEPGKPLEKILIPADTDESGDIITATEIMANLSQISSLENITKHIDGIGMLKADNIAAAMGFNPLQFAKTSPDILVQKIVDGLGHVAQFFYPKQVWYRAFDIRTDNPFEDEEREANPILGNRGVRRFAEQPELLKAEIEAVKILYNKGLNNVMFVLPFVSSQQEFSEIKTAIIDFPLKLGISVDVPAAALDIESFCKAGIDFAALNITELSSLFLAVDRDNPSVSRLYTNNQSAVLKLVRHVVDICKKYNVPTSVFGDYVNNSTDFIEAVVGMGADIISADLDCLQKVKNTVARTERRILLDKLRK